MKRMTCLKCCLVLIFSVCFLVGCTATDSETSSVDNCIIINYQRPDGIYDGWNVWVWAEGADGAAYEFTGDTEFGKQLVLEHEFPIGSVGFIIRKADWTKDVDEDRFFTLDSNGNSEIFVLSGESTFATSVAGVDELKAPRIENATIIGVQTIDIVFNNKDVYYDGFLETLTFGEVDSEGTFIDEINLTEMKRFSDTKYKVTTETALSYDKTYKLESKELGALFAVPSNKLFDSPEFIENYTYDGELGAIYSSDKTTFRVWAPFASEMILNVYPDGDISAASSNLSMSKIDGGAWEVIVDGDLHKTYYTYSVTNFGVTSEVPDPYAKAAGVNGHRSMVIDLAQTAVKDTYRVSKNDSSFSQTDAIIYELHVRDMSIAEDSGMTNKGKYLAFTETNTKNENGDLTGVSHIKELGANYIHLLPVYDYYTVDESKLETPQFNWGYDPYNYNVPEGSYSTDPYNGEVRINEFKEMVCAIHDQDMGVIMDVVYNHTSKSKDSHLNLLVPNYYYRVKWDGSFSNGSGCGNEIATERKMVRKYIVESVVYWAKEYKIDGFRFDLMGVYDVDTMNAIRAALDEINPNILMYGEGWSGGGILAGPWKAATKANTGLLDTNIAAFSDNIRDGLKGSVFDAVSPAYVNGEGAAKDSVMFGIMASTKLHGGIAPWAKEPTQTITYVSAHDNNTLFDKIQLTNPNDSLEDQIAMNNLASAVVLTSQGISFIHAGEELLRTKELSDGSLDHNSYKSPDSINELDYARKDEYSQVFNYYKGLIDLRLTFDEFRYSAATEIEENIKFIETEDNMIIYTLADKFVLIFNPYKEAKTITLPAGNYKYYVNKDVAGAVPFGDSVSGTITVDSLSATVLGK